MARAHSQSSWISPQPRGRKLCALRSMPVAWRACGVRRLCAAGAQGFSREPGTAAGGRRRVLHAAVAGSAADPDADCALAPARRSAAARHAVRVSPIHRSGAGRCGRRRAARLSEASRRSRRRTAGRDDLLQRARLHGAGKRDVGDLLPPRRRAATAFRRLGADAVLLHSVPGARPAARDHRVRQARDARHARRHPVRRTALARRVVRLPAVPARRGRAKS